MVEFFSLPRTRGYLRPIPLSAFCFLVGWRVGGGGGLVCAPVFYSKQAWILENFLLSCLSGRLLVGRSGELATVPEKPFTKNMSPMCTSEPSAGALINFRTLCLRSLAWLAEAASFSLGGESKARGADVGCSIPW